MLQKLQNVKTLTKMEGSQTLRNTKTKTMAYSKTTIKMKLKAFCNKIIINT